MQKKQTAGQDVLGHFAPKFAQLNDDVLFGQVWSRENQLSARDRSLTTIVALITSGAFEQLAYHLKKGKENGLTQTEIVEVITQLAFYVGWPKAWSAFNLAKRSIPQIMTKYNELKQGLIFKAGVPNPYSQYFTGKSYLTNLAQSPDGKVSTGVVTFEPGTRNHWHIHHNGYQILLVTGGEGWYQEEGQPARALKKGDTVVTKDGVKHWHGAKKDCWFEHIAITTGTPEWLEAVDEQQYNQL